MVNYVQIWGILTSSKAGRSNAKANVIKSRQIRANADSIFFLVNYDKMQTNASLFRANADQIQKNKIPRECRGNAGSKILNQINI